jgi:glycosyltransferase involved in cell wall biosynthesis
MPDAPLYLLVTHIPFSKTANGGALVDSLWALDLRGLAAAGWRVRVCAPEVTDIHEHKWGPGTAEIPQGSNIEFVGLPPIRSRYDVLRWPRIRAILRQQVAVADYVHTSNFFPPYLGLAYAHHQAQRQRKKTVFVIAEDFYDMLDWEWIRTNGESHRKKLLHLDSVTRKCASTASLTFIHTPAAVERYRNSARNAIAIRQPGHELEDVTSVQDLDRKCAEILGGGPLKIIAACRHKPLKGLDLLIEAIHLLRSRNISVQAWLYGNGPQTSFLKQRVESLQLNDRVFLPGTLSPGVDVYRAIAAGHIFAMPHRTTDFGRAFFDAMAGASPVVAFKTPASAGTVRDGIDGLLAPLDDIEGLAAAIERFHHDRQLLVQCAHSARERAIENTRSIWHRYRAEWTRNLTEP